LRAFTTNRPRPLNPPCQINQAARYRRPPPFWLAALVLLLVLANEGCTQASSDLVGHWRFEPDYITGRTVQDLSGHDSQGTIEGPVNLDPTPPSLVLNGSTNYVDIANGILPTRQITLKAWVVVDQPRDWAGIVNYIQDNGSIEHGWILGQVANSFMFGLSTGAITYLSANQPFEQGQWYHLVGTYDGSQMKIYVNAEHAGSSSARSGDISYRSSWYRIGSYKDDNESYLWNGKIAEVAVYATALSPQEIRSDFEARKDEFGHIDKASLNAGPLVRFYRKGQVTIHWKTDSAVPSAVEYGVAPLLDHTASEPNAKTEHSLTITGIRPQTRYAYRIIVDAMPTETYEFYSAFDYCTDPLTDSNSPYPQDSLTQLYEQAALYIINQAGLNKGVCIDYGCGQGRLAYEIAKRTDLKIVGFEEDPANVQTARERLDQAGIYGNRVSVLQASLSNLTCREFSANLVVSDRLVAEGDCPGSASQIFRLLAPAGGLAILGQPAGTLTRTALESWLAGLDYTISERAGLWARLQRPALTGAGEWTHYYADVANTANSGETRLSGNMKLLWYGQPGPRYITDRHNRPMSSLVKNGLVITPGIDRIMAYDAYNGTRYWDVAIPGATRVAILRDCGWIALAHDYVYLAHKDDCLALNLRTGRPELYLTTPTVGTDKLNWGYLAVDDQTIFGSGQTEHASLIGHSLAHVYEAYYDHKPIATSRYLFAMDRHTGDLRWTYRRATGSVIVNPCIAIGDDCIYFIESRNPQAIADDDGRVTGAVLNSAGSEYLVKLNKNTGTELQSRPLDLPFQHVMYLLYASDHNLVIAAGTHNDPGCKYSHYAFNAADLSLAWSSHYYTGGTNTDHGEQDQHPCIVGNTLYGRYYKIDLTDGTITAFGLARGNCGTQAACETHLLGRNGNPYLYQLPAGTPIRMTSETRPGCWINMIPAAGLVIVPESSAGCTCDYPLQATTVFAPK